MASPTARLYIRVRLDDGSRKYLDPVFSANGKLKPFWAVMEGTPLHRPEGTYYLRYLQNGKRIFECVGSDPGLALTAKVRRDKILAAQSVGLVVAENLPAASSPEPPSKTLTEQRRPLSECVVEYLSETRAHKSTKTAHAYTETLSLFLESLTSQKFRQVSDNRPAKGKHSDAKPLTAEAIAASTKKYIEEIDRDAAMGFAAFLKNRGNSPRTVRNRIDYLQIFLRHFGMKAVLKGKDLPKFTHKEVSAYGEEAVKKMLACATVDEADLLFFFLSTGAREQEVQYACWPDVSFEGRSYQVTEHLDLGFRPKDKEEGSVPLPDSLIDRLIARRKRYPYSRLIFPGRGNKPDGHMLRIVKRLALRAGVNCRQCINKQGKSCATHPVCRHVLLHKWRKTFATTLHENGASARTVQGLLRHSSLDTTLRYLAKQDSGKTRAISNTAFGQFA